MKLFMITDKHILNVPFSKKDKTAETNQHALIVVIVTQHFQSNMSTNRPG